MTDTENARANRPDARQMRGESESSLNEASLRPEQIADDEDLSGPRRRTDLSASPEELGARFVNEALQVTPRRDESPANADLALDDAQAAPDSDAVAAPPDAGGHLGSRTRPEELLQPSSGAHESRSPALSDDVVDRSAGAGGSVKSLLLYGALIAVVIGAFMYLFGTG